MNGAILFHAFDHVTSQRQHFVARRTRKPNGVFQKWRFGTYQIFEDCHLWQLLAFEESLLLHQI